MTTSNDDFASASLLPHAAALERKRYLDHTCPGVVQQRLLSRDVPTFGDVECSAMCRQAGAVGGDFYDVLRLPTGELRFTIGDVSGKGLGAALMMASLQATLRAEARHATGDLATLIAAANELFHEASLEHYYSTLFYAIFDPSSRMMRYVNAGQVPPMIVRKKQYDIEWLDRGGPPVGILPNCVYDVGSVALSPSDVVLAYTDGVIETQNASGEQWGIERLVRMVKESENRAPIKLRSEITEAVEVFSHDATQRDDMALVIMRVL